MKKKSLILLACPFLLAGCTGSTGNAIIGNNLKFNSSISATYSEGLNEETYFQTVSGYDETIKSLDDVYSRISGSFPKGMDFTTEPIHGGYMVESDVNVFLALAVVVDANNVKLYKNSSTEGDYQAFVFHNASMKGSLGSFSHKITADKVIYTEGNYTLTATGELYVNDVLQASAVFTLGLKK